MAVWLATFVVSELLPSFSEAVLDGLRLGIIATEAAERFYIIRVSEAIVALDEDTQDLWRTVFSLVSVNNSLLCKKKKERKKLN